MRIAFQSNARQVIAALDAMPDKMLHAIADAMHEENEHTMSHIQRTRLSFPKHGPATLEGLRVQSNRLRVSLARGGPDNIYEPPVIAGQTVRSAFGTNVRYANILEEGFSGTVNVPGHSRKNLRTEAFQFGAKRALKRKVRGADSFVRPHQRRVNIIGRHYMSRGIEECAPNYSRAVSAAVETSWNGGTP